MCSRPFSTSRFAHLCGSRPRGSILAPILVTFTLITRTAQCSRQLPSCVAVYPRDSQSRVFYVAESISSIDTRCRHSLVVIVPLCPASRRDARFRKALVLNWCICAIENRTDS